MPTIVKKPIEITDWFLKQSIPGCVIKDRQHKNHYADGAVGIFKKTDEKDFLFFFKNVTYKVVASVFPGGRIYVYDQSLINEITELAKKYEEYYGSSFDEFGTKRNFLVNIEYEKPVD